MTRWNLTISDETDRAVRTFLVRNGGKKGDLSRFVEEAVRQRVFDLTVRLVKERNAKSDQRQILDLINDEVGAEVTTSGDGSTMRHGGALRHT